MRVPGEPTAGVLAIDGIEATFVAEDPPRRSWIALWHPTRRLGEADAVLTIARPANDEVVPTEIDVCTLGLGRAIETLTRTPPPPTASSSVHSLAAIIAWTLGQIAQGRIRPGLTPTGRDSWQIGPLTDATRTDLGLLAAALPVELRATVTRVIGAGAHPVTMVPTAQRTAEALMNAVVDTLARTPAMAQAAGHEAFAATAPVLIDARAAIDAYRGLAGDRLPLITLRLQPPSPFADSDAFTGSLAFQDRNDPRSVLPVAALWDAPARVRERLTHAGAELNAVLRRAAKVWAPLQRLLESAQPSTIELSNTEVDALLGPVANRLGAVGLSVHVPAELFSSLSLHPILVAPPGSVGSARLRLDALLELRWQGALDGERLREDELAELIAATRSIVQLRGRWIRLDERSVQKLRERRTMGTPSALAAALGSEVTVEGQVVDVSGVRVLSEVTERLQTIDNRERLGPPERLNATLRPYQERGLAWLDEMDQLGLGGVLADDMGLGKTIQVIALHLHRQASTDVERHRPMLVVCPASVMGNWEREVQRFAPGTGVTRYHGAGRALPDPEPGHIVLTTYGVARRDHHRLRDIRWGVVVADEAQAIKNPNSRTARAMRQIGREATRFALTGTPLQNQLSDLWAILDWTTPGLLGPLERFRNEIAVPVERERDPVETERLNQLLRPFLLRRRKTDATIAPDLPPKTETNEIVPLTAEQAALYRAVVEETMAEIAGVEGVARRGLVLRLVTRLKQVCNHPAHFLRQDGPLPRRSGKLTAATELLEVIRDAGDAALVFTQYVAMAKLLEQHWTARGFRTLMLHGALSLNEREARVAQFQGGEADVFIISLRAGGVGVNLTAATHVIHYDRWWNPAVEDQASDRAWRIGQTRPVQIHRLICEGTIEDRIAVMLDDKRVLADSVVGSGEEWISRLSDGELAKLVELSVDAMAESGDES